MSKQVRVCACGLLQILGHTIPIGAFKMAVHQQRHYSPACISCKLCIDAQCPPKISTRRQNFKRMPEFLVEAGRGGFYGLLDHWQIKGQSKFARKGCQDDRAKLPDPRSSEAPLWWVVSLARRDHSSPERTARRRTLSKVVK